MQFFTGDWKDLLDAAQKQHKMIFIDVYTDWCGPCKYMDKFIFTKPKVGEKYNALFLNYKLNAEKGEGIALAKKYGVNAFPTFLFLNSSGYLVHKVIGEKEEQPFIDLSREAVTKNADKNNLGYLKKAYDAGKREPVFLRTYLNRLTAANLDNGVVLDEYFKTLSTPELKQDSNLLYLAQQINGKKTQTQAYVMSHYDELSDSKKAKITNRLFDKLVYTEAGLALKEERFTDYASLVAFGKQLYGLNEKQLIFLNRIDLMYSVATKNYPQLKSAGYTMVKKPLLVHTDTIKAEDKRQYEAIMRPYITGEKDSTKAVGFQEDKVYIINLYTREITYYLYTAAEAFSKLPLTEEKALTDALQWTKRCVELSPEVNIFSTLQKTLEEKIKR